MLVYGYISSTCMLLLYHALHGSGGGVRPAVPASPGGAGGVYVVLFLQHVRGSGAASGFVPQ